MPSTNLHPIESLMQTSMENIKKMIEVNTVIGDAIETGEGTIIMPVTKASFGFVAGGAEYGTIKNKDDSDKEEKENNRYPFGGGSGAGVSVQPVAFMVIDKKDVQILHVHHHFGTTSKVIEEIPNIINKLGSSVNLKLQNKESTNKETK